MYMNFTINMFKYRNLTLINNINSNSYNENTFIGVGKDLVIYVVSGFQKQYPLKKSFHGPNKPSKYIL